MVAIAKVMSGIFKIKLEVSHIMVNANIFHLRIAIIFKRKVTKFLHEP